MFREELAALEREGVLNLSPEQRAGVERHLESTLADLARRFDVDTTETERRFSWGMRIASTLGGAALSAAVYLFFYRIWGLLTTPVQAALLILLPVAALAATHVAALRDRTLYYAALLSLLTFGCFVLDLNALAALLHVTPSRNAFLAWGAFGVALAYAYGMRLPLLAGLVCLQIWLAADLAAWKSDWFSVAERPENFLAGGFAMVAASFLPRGRWDDFPPVYRLLGLLSVFLPILLLSEAGGLSYLTWSNRRIETLYQAAGFAAAAGAIWLGVSLQWTAEVYLASAFFTIFLYARFAHWWWDWMPHYLFFLVVGLISIGLLALFRRLRRAL